MLQLLESLFGEALSPERRIAVFTTPGRQTRLFADYQQLAEYATQQSPTQNVYFGLGLVAGQPQGRGKFADIAGIGGLWCDIDISSEAHPKANLPQSIEEARGLLAVMPLVPSAIVSSGHGLHAYWLLHEPWLFTSDVERQKAAALAKRWHGLVCRKAAARGWSLENLGDLTRVLRLPGTLNHNGNGQPVEVRILEFAPHLRYAPDDFEPYLSPEPVPATAAVGELVVRPDAEPPANKLLETAGRSPLFWQTWNRQRNDLADPSPSGYDLSLASIAVLNGWSDQEVADLLIAFRRHHGDKPEKALRPDYLRRTIAKARQALPGDEPVDLSGLIGPADPPPPAEATVPDPGPIPEALLWVPGFVGEVMDFCLSAARYPNLPLAFCGAIALQSFLASRKVREPGGLRPNLYLLALAGSGTGKAYPRKINAYVLGRAEMGAMVGNQIASGQGLEDEMLAHRKMLYQTDEVDHLLRCIASPKESYYSMLLAMLLQLYTEADEVHVARARARDRHRKPEPRGEIDQPGLVIFGTATPECFFEALSPKLLTNGLFSRAIVLDAQERGHKQRPRDVSEIPPHLIDVAAWWRDYNPAPVDPATDRQPNLNDEHPTPAVIPYSDDGYAVLDHFATAADEAYDAATRQGNLVQAILWTRASENAIRLAINYAVSRDRFTPVIDQEVGTWAVRFAEHLVRRMLFLASMHVAENEFHAECLKLLRKLQEAGGQMTRRELMRRMHCKAADFDQIIGTLVQQGDIQPVEIPTRTKTALGYRVA